MPQCYVLGCHNYYEKTRGSKGIIYHMFPSDKKMASKWGEACGRKNEPLPYYSRVCSNHFSEKCYRRDLQHELLGLPLRKKLKAGVVPDINLSEESNVIKSECETTRTLLSQNQVEFDKPELKSNTKRKTLLSAKKLEKIKTNPKFDPQNQSSSLAVSSPAKEVVKSIKGILRPNSKPGKERVAAIPVRSSYRIAMKTSIESLSDSFTEKVNNKRNSFNEKSEKFSDKLKFMAKIRLKFERKDKPTTSKSMENGNGESLNKMQIVENVPTRADDNEHDEPSPAPSSTACTDLKENGDLKIDELDDEDKLEETSNQSGSSETERLKRKVDVEVTPLKESDHEKRLKVDQSDVIYTVRDKLLSDLVDVADCDNVEQVQSFSEQILQEIKTLNELAKEKEKEWNQILHLKKLKEELLIRLQRKRQVLMINEGEYQDFLPETNSNGQQSVLKSNQTNNTLYDLRAANLEKLKSRNNFLQSAFKQKPMLDVQSIIADYRQRHPGMVPRRGRRIRNSQTEQQDIETDLISNGFKLEKSDLRPPPPYPEVTVHPVTNTSSASPTNSLLHGILTKAPLRQTTQPAVNGGKSSFSPTLARLLTAPEKSGALISTPNILGASILNAGNISQIFSGSKVRNEITITPVGSQYQVRTKTEPDDEVEDPADRLIIDESMDTSSAMKVMRVKDDNNRSSEDGDEVPQCQGCNQRVAQFVCAGCGNQWYCSRECQVTAWDDHSEVCSG